MKPFKKIVILFKRRKEKTERRNVKFLFHWLFGKTDRIGVGGGKVFADAGFCSTN